MEGMRKTAPAVAAVFLFAAALGAEQDADRVGNLLRSLDGVSVALPDGGEAAVIGPEGGLLGADEVATCVETVDEAQAWPALWLVVQREGTPLDLVMRLERREGSGVVADFVFATPRRDWDAADVRRLARERLGRKPPREGQGNLVVQGFSKRVEHHFRYRLARSDKGLGALLPEGTMIRASQSLDLDAGGRYTLALVIEEPTFHPADCSSCGAAVFGHADSGRVALVLADGQQLLDRLELTPMLGGSEGIPLVPRFRCEEGDTLLPRDDTVWERLSSRRPVPLLEPTDRDGDGRALEVEIPAALSDCETWSSLVVAVDERELRLRVVGRRERPLR